MTLKVEVSIPTLAIVLFSEVVLADTLSSLPATLLDPDPFDGSETPLSLAAQAGVPVEGIRALVLGGAHLDFRNRDSLTPVHKAVRAHNHAGLLVRNEAYGSKTRSITHSIVEIFILPHRKRLQANIWALFLSYQVLLSLGASPNYRDRCGLTPLYHTVLTGGDTSCCETLLYYRARLGTTNENGWDESHQVPKSSL